MNITVNGNKKSIQENLTVKQFLEQTDGFENREGIAVAINDEVVPRSEWDQRKISEGDSIEVIQAVQGG